MSQLEVVIRSVDSAEQRAQLVRVLEDAPRYRREQTSHRNASAWAASMCEERDIDPGRSVYVACIKGAVPVAALELSRDGDVLTIAQLIVAEPFRFLGIGEQVVEWAGAFAVEQGAGMLGLGVASNNAGAVAFWEALGFQRTGRLGKGASSLWLMERVSETPALGHRAQYGRRNAGSADFA